MKTNKRIIIKLISRIIIIFGIYYLLDSVVSCKQFWNKYYSSDFPNTFVYIFVEVLEHLCHGIAHGILRILEGLVLVVVLKKWKETKFIDY